MTRDEGNLPVNPSAGGEAFSLYFQSWKPDADCKAIILLVHGYAEHGGRYGHVAEHCTSKGYAVYAPDHWGHGKTEGEGGFVPRFSHFTDGVAALYQRVKSDFPDKPIILLGHSMGGLISSLYLLDHQVDFVGCVLSGPAIMVVDQPGAVQMFIMKLLSRLFPKLGVITLDSDGVSRNPKVVADYLADPLVYNGKMRARLAMEMFLEMNRVQEEASKISLPMLLMHGEADSLTASEGSEFLNANIASADRTLKIYPDLYHEIFNEPEKDAVLTEMTDWMDIRITA